MSIILTRCGNYKKNVFKCFKLLKSNVLILVLLKKSCMHILTLSTRARFGLAPVGLRYESTAVELNRCPACGMSTCWEGGISII